MEDSQKNMIVPIVVGIVCIALGFAGGRYYQQQKTPRMPLTRSGEDRMMFRGMGNGSGAMMGKAYRPVVGEIIQTDESTLTVKLADGSTKLILLSENTQVSKSQQATTADMKAGEKVTVFGDEDGSGALSAKNIQLGESFRIQERQEVRKEQN